MDAVSKESSGGTDSNAALTPGSAVGSVAPADARTFKVQAFTRLQAGSGYQITYTTGPTASLKISAGPDILSKLSVKFDNGTLHLGVNGNFSTHQPIVATIVNPSLNGIELSGGTTGEFRGISASSLDIQLSGASNAKVLGTANAVRVESSGGSILSLDTRGGMDISGMVEGASQLTAASDIHEMELTATGGSTVSIDRLTAHKATITLDGASSLSAHGSADSLTAEASGASTLKLERLKVGSATVTASGASNVSLGATSSLNAEASGASSIKYAGNPKVTQDASGASSIGPG